MSPNTQQRSEPGSLFIPDRKTCDDLMTGAETTNLPLIKRAIMAPCKKKTDTGITPTGKLVLIVLTSLADETGQCSPSMNELAEITGYSRVAIIQNIAQLEKSGFIRRIQSVGYANTYRITHQKWPMTLRSNAA